MELRQRAQQHDNQARVMRPVLAAFLGLALLLALASCRRYKEETLYLPGEEIPPGASATLVCNDQCRDRSQCGTIDADWVVLASSGGPATASHDLTFPAGATVTVVGQQQRTLQYIGDSTKTEQINFYKVEVPNAGAGWVAGWCIAQPIVP